MRTIIACLILVGCHSEENLGNTAAPTRTILASSTRPFLVMDYLALDADYVYWVTTDDGTPGVCVGGACTGSTLDLFRVPRSGGDVDKLAQVPVGSDFIAGLAIDDNYISTSVSGVTQRAQVLIRVPKTGGGVQILDDTPTSNAPVAADDDFLYTWFDDNVTSELRAYPASGGSPAVIIDPFWANSAVIAHDKLLYFVDGAGALVSVPRIGGSPTEISLGFTGSSELVATADTLYILLRQSSSDGFSSCNGQIVTMSFADGTVQTIVGGICASHMAVMANTIITWSEDTKIVAYNLDGTGEREVLTDQGAPQFFAADTTDEALFYNSGNDIIALDFN